MPDEVQIVWMPRVVVRENGVTLDVPHFFQPDTNTHVVCETVTRPQAYAAGFEAGFYYGQIMPKECVDRVKMELPILDVNQGEEPDDSGGLFG